MIKKFLCLVLCLSLISGVQVVPAGATPLPGTEDVPWRISWTAGATIADREEDGLHLVVVSGNNLGGITAETVDGVHSIKPTHDYYRMAFNFGDKVAGWKSASQAFGGAGQGDGDEIEIVINAKWDTSFPAENWDPQYGGFPAITFDTGIPWNYQFLNLTDDFQNHSISSNPANLPTTTKRMIFTLPGSDGWPRKGHPNSSFQLQGRDGYGYCIPYWIHSITITNITMRDAAPGVHGVAVTPNTPEVWKGRSQQFTANVTASGGASNAVTWSVIGNTHVGTTINSAGLLSVHADETAETLTVTATSVYNTAVSGTATVTVVAPDVTDVSVIPEFTDVARGFSRQFTADVTAVGGANPAVNWNVSGNANAGTAISSAGLLSVHENETAETLTVTATSQFKNTVVGTATVEVIDLCETCRQFPCKCCPKTGEYPCTCLETRFVSLGLGASVTLMPTDQRYKTSGREIQEISEGRRSSVDFKTVYRPLDMSDIPAHMVLTDEEEIDPVWENLYDSRPLQWTEMSPGHEQGTGAIWELGTQNNARGPLVIRDAAPFRNRFNGTVSITLANNNSYISAGDSWGTYGDQMGVRVRGTSALEYKPFLGLLCGVETRIVANYHIISGLNTPKTVTIKYRDLNNDPQIAVIPNGLNGQNMRSPGDPEGLFRLVDLGVYPNVESVVLSVSAPETTNVIYPSITFEVVNENPGLPSPQPYYRTYTAPELEENRTPATNIPMRPGYDTQAPENEPDAPTFSHSSGFFNDPFDLIITPPEGTVVYYTLDGSIPTRGEARQWSAFAPALDVRPGSNARFELHSGGNILAREQFPDIVSHQLNGAIPITNVSNTKANFYSAIKYPLSANAIFRNAPFQNVGAHSYVPTENVDKGVVVRARAFDINNPDCPGSPVTTGTFFVGYDMAEKFGNGMVISAVLDPEDMFADWSDPFYVPINSYLSSPFGAEDPRKGRGGLLMRRDENAKGQAFEYQTHLTFFEGEGVPVIDQPAGMRIRGLGSRTHDNNSFNFYSRRELGAPQGYFDYPLLPDAFDVNGEQVTRFRNIGMRQSSSGGSAQTTRYIASVPMHAAKDLDIGSQASRQVSFFLNGEFWGSFMLQQRVHEDFVNASYGVPRDQVNLISNHEANDSDAEWYLTEYGKFLEGLRPNAPNWRDAPELKEKDQDNSRLSTNDFTDPANLEWLHDTFDVDQAMQFMAANLSMGNYDFGGYNFVQWKSRPPYNDNNPYQDGRWRYLIDDLDGAYLNSGGNEQIHMLQSIPIGVAFMRTSPVLRERFLNTICDIISGPYNGTNIVRELQYRQDNLTNEMMKNQASRFNNHSEAALRNGVGGKADSVLIREALLLNYMVEPSLDPAEPNTRTYNFGVPEGWDLVPMVVKIDNPNKGTVHVNTITNHDYNRGSFSSRYFNTLSQDLKAIPNEGYAFVRWEMTPDVTFIEGNQDSEFIRVKLSDKGAHISPIFEPSHSHTAPDAPTSSLASGISITNVNTELSLTTTTPTADIKYIIRAAGSNTVLVAEQAYTGAIKPFTLVNPAVNPVIVIEAWAETEDSVSTSTFITLKWHDLDSLVALFEYTHKTASETLNSYPATGGTLGGTATMEFYWGNGDRRTIGRGDLDRPVVNAPNSKNHPWAGSADPNTSPGWVFKIDTLGFENICFSSEQSSTGSGPRDWNIAYRVGGSGTTSGFTALDANVSLPDEDPDPNVASTVELGTTFDNIMLPAAVNNQEDVYIKIFITSSNGRRTGTFTSAGNGNTSINNIVIAGTKTDVITITDNTDRVTLYVPESKRPTVSANAMLLAASYNDQGILVDIMIFDNITLDANGTFEGMLNGFTRGTTFKAFLWDTNLAPIIAN